jgi:uncharacterized protein (DUF433 family)/DNA-binding transcriptional MerR regulator
MLHVDPREHIFGRGVYSAPEALRLLNFHREAGEATKVSPQTVRRWLCGYDFDVGETKGHSDPLWRPDYGTTGGELEVSFRDLIELRFVKAFRDAGLSLHTIRRCFEQAVREVQDERPFSTQRFRTDGKTIFLDITRDVHEGEMLDLRQRQNVFRTLIAPSLKDLEFDAEAVSRWFPMGLGHKEVVVDPSRSFGRPIAADGGVPTEILAQAVAVEGSQERVARLYEVPISAVRTAVAFEARLAA